MQVIPQTSYVQNVQQVHSNQNMLNQVRNNQQQTSNIRNSQVTHIQTSSSLSNQNNLNQQYMTQNIVTNTQLSNLTQSSNNPLNEEDEKYSRKIEELKQHLPRLDKMLNNSSNDLIIYSIDFDMY